MALSKDRPILVDNTTAFALYFFLEGPMPLWLVFIWCFVIIPIIAFIVLFLILIFWPKE